MGTYAYPHLGSKRINAVTSADVLTALSEIWNTRPETARRVKQRIGTVMKWAMAQGWRLDNPADTISKALPKHDRSKIEHRKALPYADVAGAIERVRNSNAGLSTKLVFEFLVLTATRSGEALRAVWSEIDLAQAVWTIPASRMKAKKPHLRMGAGRTTLRAAANRQRVVLEAAEVINKSADQPWIVLYNDLKTIDIAGELATACAKPANLHFVKWGDHRANNDLRHIKRVMCLGLYRLPTVGYDQAHIAASGASTDRVVDRQGVRDSALRSSMLQGFARSNMRNHDFGRCGGCEVYVIDAEAALVDHLEEAFPDCKVVPWTPSAPKLTKQQTRICGYVRTLPTPELATGVARAEIYRALSIDKSNFAKQITPELRAALAEHGILVNKRRFYIEPA